MTRALGVFVVMFALAATASADKEATKSAPDKAADKVETKKSAKKAAAKKGAAEADPGALPTDDESALGADEDMPLTDEEIEAGLPPHLKGPKLVDLGHDIEIDLPEGMLLYEHTEAKKMLEEYGDSGETVIAIITKLDATWQIVVDYDDVGYVTDKDANELDAQALFHQFELGNIKQNERRKQLGVSPLYLDGWSEMPSYKAQQHHLVWGLKGHSDEGPVINFFTRILGRNGFMSVNLIDSPETIEQSKQDSAGVLAAIRYKTGARYEDHQEGDRDSGLGLNALVLGGAGVAAVKVAKTGFLIKLLLVLKKGAIVIILAIGGLFKWLLGRKKNDDAPPPDDGAPVPPPTAPAE
jgi:uncharacterized membrane-anchored protein